MAAGPALLAAIMEGVFAGGGGGAGGRSRGRDGRGRDGSERGCCRRGKNGPCGPGWAEIGDGSFPLGLGYLRTTITSRRVLPKQTKCTKAVVCLSAHKFTTRTTSRNAILASGQRANANPACPSTARRAKQPCEAGWPPASFFTHAAAERETCRRRPRPPNAPLPSASTQTPSASALSLQSANLLVEPLDDSVLDRPDLQHVLPPCFMGALKHRPCARSLPRRLHLGMHTVVQAVLDGRARRHFLAKGSKNCIGRILEWPCARDRFRCSMAALSCVFLGERTRKKGNGDLVLRASAIAATASECFSFTTI